MPVIKFRCRERLGKDGGGQHGRESFEMMDMYVVAKRSHGPVQRESYIHEKDISLPTQDESPYTHFIYPAYIFIG